MILELPELTAHGRYKLLTALVVPRPIAWISTWNANGVANCAPYSFFNVFCEEPALCAVGFGPRSDRSAKHTLRNVRRTGAFVVNLVDEAVANAMHASSAELAETESEFERAGVTVAPSLHVPHPRIAEAAASFECRTVQSLPLVGEREIVIAEMLTLHARDGIVDLATGRVAESSRQPVGRLYGTRYCTTRQRFDLPGPLPDDPPA